MTIKNIFYSSHFARSFKKLPQGIQKMAVEKEKTFRDNCFDKKLETHKLKGKLQNYWSFSITHSHRILFEFINENSAGFIDIGDHDIYK